MFLLYCICWFLIILTVVLSGFAVSRQWYYNQGLAYPVPKCYDDWLCLKNVNGVATEVNMSEKIVYGKNSRVQNCMPLTKETLCSPFTYTNNGTTVTEIPATKINTWSIDPACTSGAAKGDYSACPFYKEGDIYWRACYLEYFMPGQYDPNRTYYETTKKNPANPCNL